MISIFGSKKRIQDLEREISFLREQLQKANEKISQLEERLAQSLKNSRNSSKPPSSDGPQDNKPTTISKKADKRKPGGQPGHPGHSRKLLPEEQVDCFQQFRPAQCGHCQRIFDGREETHLLSRHQQYELKDKPIQVTESQCLEAICPQCGGKSRGDLPGEWRSGLGTNLLALTAILTAYRRVPRRVVQELLSTVLQLPISLGSVQAAVEEAGDAAGPVAEELRRQLPQEAVLNIDETGWRCQGKKAWLWVFVASRFVYYWIDPKRHRAVLDQVLGEAFAGALCSDRWAAYLSYLRRHAAVLGPFETGFVGYGRADQKPCGGYLLQKSLAAGETNV